MKQDLSRGKRAAFALMAMLLTVAFLEVFVSVAYLAMLRIKGAQPFTLDEPSYFSLINIPYKAAMMLGLIPYSSLYQFGFERTPSPFSRPDDELGYKVVPNSYSLTFLRKKRNADAWERFKVSEKRNLDGTRWTGDCDRNSRRTVHIFGDSWVAGSGVNDEQTFSYLLQNARPDLCVKLHAVEGYGMVQSLIRFRQLKDSISANDMVVLGYADYYDLRNVAAPSRLRETEYWLRVRLGRAVDSVKLPKASINSEGQLVISYIQQRCDENDGYCLEKDPHNAEMSLITSKIVKMISEESPARVFLLHFDGHPENKALAYVREDVTKISALSSDFDYIVQDDIMGFDPHPGPYWHYAISRKLIKYLK